MRHESQEVRTAFGGRRLARSLASLFFAVVFLCCTCADSTIGAAQGPSNLAEKGHYSPLGAPTDYSAYQLGDGTLTYPTGEYDEDFVTLPERPHDPVHRAPRQEQVKVERHVVFVAEGRPQVPVVKGRGFFILGLIMLAMCISAIHSDPRGRNAGFLEGVSMNARNLVAFRDLTRSLFVVLTAITSPLLIAWGAKRLIKTLPAYVKWAKDNDEFGLGYMALMFLYIWMFFFDSKGQA
ncbi:hypothetical protein, conserved [Eimeria necatrix]|uniref:Uncharacterized protein n=1 Tax=Eimeria necatrix TaxID=51315 RepID=U6MSG6_9EIME|nr:hypothetical protein, conserved [Eimeria necatrix]CDJ66971.1 hypothetical protein, conserved [Eimeria necatrix]